METIHKTSAENEFLNIEYGVVTGTQTSDYGLCQ